jgi:uncharacterized membrane protein
MGKIFKRGMIALAPLALTLALVLWLFNALEAMFKPPVEALIGKEYYFTGLGILIAFILIFIVGVLLNSWLIQRISNAGTALVKKIPLVKTIYNSIGEVMSYFNSTDARKDGQVVSVEVAGMKLVGLVTRDTFTDAPKGIAEEGDIAVYMPMSYQIGGYTVILPRSQVKPLPMTVEEGLRFTVTAGVLVHPQKKTS